jgi:biopolymer transport protein ExbD
MRIKDPVTEGEEPYNLVPLTDMVFNLLIFFMCATTFAQIEKEMTVQLPHTTTSFRPLSAPPRQLIINVREDGSAVVAGRTCNNDELGEVLSTALAKDGSTSVIVRADERTIMRYFAAVAGTCRRAGVGETRISYVDDSPPAPGQK